ncbi:hypothetical protein B0H19DRAFT_380306 [Mycena capillaripes]|nr:hypothetical protein B0H19DRAFT_380306 [Mycena capillaripes]
MSSGSRTLFGGSLKLLQDLSSGSNIPALEPLVNVAVRIYTAAEGARNNKKRANELAEDVGNSVKQILQVYPKESNSVAGCTPDLYDEGIGKFQRTLENAVAVLEKIGGRRWISRVLNQQHDAEELVESRARINEAKLEFLVTIQMAKDRTRQREHQYPMFQQADLDVEQMWNSTSRSYTRAIARLVPRGKEVVVRQYNNKSSFIQDIENLIPLRHPNLPFVGASALTAPRPFILMEPVHTSARDVIRGLFYESQTVFQRKAIQIIAGVLEGINHLRENEFALLHLKVRRVLRPGIS